MIETLGRVMRKLKLSKVSLTNKSKEKPHYVYSNLLKMPVLKGSVKIYHRPENNKHNGVCGFAIDGELYLEGEASAEYRKWLYKEAEKLNGKGDRFI